MIKNVLPLLEQDLFFPWLPLGKDIATQWAGKYNYPLDDTSQLSRVAQFLAIDNNDYLSPKKIIVRELGKINPPDFSLEKYRYAIFNSCRP